MYHGSPAERAELRRTVMLPPGSKPKTTVSPKAGKKITRITKSTEAPTKRSQKLRNKGKQAAEAPEITTGDTPLRRSRRFRKSTIVTESDDDEKEEAYQPEEDDDELQVMDVDSPPLAEEDTKSTSFPIVLTTYEMIIKDRVHLARYNWGYIVVDEGHRLKNLDCKLMKEIKKYNSAGRMILTGTPLHV
jgi:ATP-dependent DNA helicase